MTKILDDILKSLDKQQSASLSNDTIKKEELQEEADEIDEHINQEISTVNNSSELTVDVNHAELVNTFLQRVSVSMDLTDAEAKELTIGMNELYESYLSSVKKCDPSKCENETMCPFSRINRYPNEQLCPIEKQIADDASNKYYELLEQEIGTTNFNFVEVSAVNTLIQLELEEFRSRGILIRDGAVIDVAALSVHNTGEILYNKAENPILNVIDRIDRRKHRLLQRLLITPESKARFKIDVSGRQKESETERLSKLQERLSQLKT